MLKKQFSLKRSLTPLAIISLAFWICAGIPANAQVQDRWYGLVRCTCKISATQAYQRVVDSKLAFSTLDTKLVGHLLWLNTGLSSWVEVGYAKGYVSFDLTDWTGNESKYLWGSGTANGYTQRPVSIARVGDYTKFSIVWDTNNRRWNFNVNDVIIGSAANTGVSTGTKTDVGLETNDPSQSSAAAPTYNFSMATLSSWSWQPWPVSALSTVSDAPAKFVWVNKPTSGQSSLN